MAHKRVRKWQIAWIAGVLAVNIFTAANPVLALPVGGQAVEGSGSVIKNGDRMTIQQSSSRMLLNWQDFSIGGAETVQFIQPSQSAVVINKVTGGAPSEIFGRLLANGQVFLINPSGILFGPTASLDVGGLVASTLDVAVRNDGRYAFGGAGNSGLLVNKGRITAGDEGSIVFIGPQVINEGSLTANHGMVALAAGKEAILGIGDDGLLNIVVDSGTFRACVANHGIIQSDGGRAVLTAKTAGELAGLVVNNTGIIQAKSLVERNGAILLEVGDAGIVENSGILDVSGRYGGTVKLLGEKVGLTGGAKIDASGELVGGTVLVGGNYQGKGPEPNARMVYMGPGAVIEAGATAQGRGGTVILWADDTTRFLGTVSAGGEKGFTETSGKNYLEAEGRVLAGEWLLDPGNLIIGNYSDWGVVSDKSRDPYQYESMGSNARLSVSTIQKALNQGTSVTVYASKGAGQQGNLELAGSIIKSSGSEATLKLWADNNIRIYNPDGISMVEIASTSGKMNIIINSNRDETGTGAVYLNKTQINSNGGDIIFRGGNDVGPNPDLKPAVGDTMDPFYKNGVALVASGLNAGTGNILINGQGARPESSVKYYAGIRLEGSTLTTSGNGSIALNGTGSSDAQGYGVYFHNASAGSRLTAGEGTIIITGVGGQGTNDSYGVFMRGGGQSPHELSSAGEIRINGSEEGLNLQGALIRSDGQGISLTGDKMDLNASIAARGSITVSPFSAGTEIGLGDGASGTLNLDSAELARLSGGVLAIGSGSAGAVDIRELNFDRTAEIFSPNSNIGVNGLINMNGQDLKFRAKLIVLNQDIKGAGKLTAEAAEGITVNSAIEAVNIGFETLSGDIILNSGARLTAYPDGDLKFILRQGSFTNNAGPDALQVSGAGRVLVQLPAQASPDPGGVPDKSSKRVLKALEAAGQSNGYIILPAVLKLKDAFQDVADKAAANIDIINGGITLIKESENGDMDVKFSQ